MAVTINNLTDDDLCLIFDHLSPRQLLSVERVNKTWQRCVRRSTGRIKVLCRKPCFQDEFEIFNDWQHVHERYSQQTTLVINYDQLSNFVLPKLDNVRCLDLFQGQCYEKDLIQVLSLMSNLKCFYFVMNQFEYSILFWEKLFELKNQLTRFGVCFYYDLPFELNQLDETTSNICKFISLCTKLESVVFSLLPGVVNIVESFKYLKSSTIVSINYCDDTENVEGVDFICKKTDQLVTCLTTFNKFINHEFSRLLSLRLVYRDNDNITTISLPFLKSLHLVSDSNNNRCFDEFQQRFDRLDRLEELVITRCNCVDGFSKLSLLEKTPMLKRLVVDRCNWIPVLELDNKNCCQKLETIELFCLRLRSCEHLTNFVEQLNELASLRSFSFVNTIYGMGFNNTKLKSLDSIESFLNSVSNLSIEKPAVKLSIKFLVADKYLMLINPMIVNCKFNIQSMKIICEPLRSPPEAEDDLLHLYQKSCEKLINYYVWYYEKWPNMKRRQSNWVRLEVKNLIKNPKLILKHAELLKIIKPTFNSTLDPVIKLNQIKDGRPVYVLPSNGDNFFNVLPLVEKLPFPVYGLNWNFFIDQMKSIDSITDYFVFLMAKLEPQGDYTLICYLFGEAVGMRMLEKGAKIKKLIIINFWGDEVEFSNKYFGDELTRLLKSLYFTNVDGILTTLKKNLIVLKTEHLFLEWDLGMKLKIIIKAWKKYYEFDARRKMTDLGAVRDFKGEENSSQVIKIVHQKNTETILKEMIEN